MEEERNYDMMKSDFTAFGLEIPAKFTNPDRPEIRRMMQVRKRVKKVIEEADLEKKRGDGENNEKEFEKKVIQNIHNGRVTAALKACDDFCRINLVAGKTIKGLTLFITGQENYYSSIRELVEAAAVGLDDKAVNALKSILELGMNNGIYPLLDPEALKGEIRPRSAGELMVVLKKYLTLDGNWQAQTDVLGELFVAAYGYILVRDGKEKIVEEK